MKAGLSLLWGEIIPAAELDYEMTTALQTVCPICKAPVFKVERRRQDEVPSHYLAHFPSGNAGESEAFQECENRIRSLGQAGLRDIASPFRGQSLERFVEAVTTNAKEILDRVMPEGNGTGPTSAIADELAADYQFRQIAGLSDPRIPREAKAAILADRRRRALDPREATEARRIADEGDAEAAAAAQRTLEGHRAWAFARDVQDYLATPHAAESRYVAYAVGALFGLCLQRTKLDLDVGRGLTEILEGRMANAKDLVEQEPLVGWSWIEEIRDLTDPRDRKAGHRRIVGAVAKVMDGARSNRLRQAEVNCVSLAAMAVRTGIEEFLMAAVILEDEVWPTTVERRR